MFHFCYISEESRGIKAGKNLVYFDPLSLPSEALKLFDHLFQLKRKVQFSVKKESQILTDNSKKF